MMQNRTWKPLTNRSAAAGSFRRLLALLSMILCFALLLPAALAEAPADDAALTDADRQFIQELPGVWDFSNVVQQEEGDPIPLANLTLAADGKASLYCLGKDGEYAYTCEGEWAYEPVPEQHGQLKLLFTKTDDPAAPEGEYRLECVYSAYMESWANGNTIVSYLMLENQLSESTSPIQALYGQNYAVFNRTQEPNMKVINCKEYVSLREEASSESPRLASVPLGAKVLAFPAVEGENEFIRCVYQGQYGYIMAEYLKAIE